MDCEQVNVQTSKKKSKDKGDFKRLESSLIYGTSTNIAEFENRMTAGGRHVQTRLKNINTRTEFFNLERFILEMDMRPTATRVSSTKLNLRQYLELDEKVARPLLFYEEKASSFEWIADSSEARQQLEHRKAKLRDLRDRKLGMAKVPENVSFAAQITVLLSSSSEKDES